MEILENQEEVIGEIIGEIKEISPYLAGEDRDDFTLFTDHFREDFPRQMELSITPHDTSTGLMTKGVGPEYAGRVRSFLAKSGIDDEAIEVFNEVEKHFPDVNLLIKRDFYEKKKFKFTLYWQYLIPVKILNRMARKFDIGSDSLDFYNEICLLLRSHSVYLGMGFAPGKKPSFKIFFGNPLKKCADYIAQGLSALMGKMNLDASTINYFIGIHDFLVQEAKGSLFSSFSFDNKPPAGMKLDYEIIPLPYVFEVMKALNLPVGEGLRLKQAMEVMKMRNLTYLGIRFVPGKVPGLKFYLDRRYSDKNLNNPEILAGFLTETIWTP